MVGMESGLEVVEDKISPRLVTCIITIEKEIPAFM